MVERGPEISFVWTPATPEPVFPERVPFLIDAFRRIQVKEARNAVLIGAAFVGLGVLLAVGLQEWRVIYRNVFFVFGALGLTEGLWQYERSRHYTQEDAVSDAGTARFASWLQNKSISGYTFGFAFIDNAAHLGGLGGGLLLGWFFLRRNAERIKRREKFLKFGGLAALLALGLITASAVYRMFV